MHLSIFLSWAALAITATPAAANTFIPPAEIDRAVFSFLGAPAGSPGGAVRAVDPRLRLAVCANDLEVTWYGRTGASLQVSCPDKGWRVFVPVGANGTTSFRGNRLSEPVVKKGETVSIIYEGAGFTLTRQGEALEAGTQDKWIKVKPVGEKTAPVSGQVLRPGVVSVFAS